MQARINSNGAYPPISPSQPETQLTCQKSRDSSSTYLHLHASHHADLLESFTSVKLPAEEIDVAPQHQPLNPDDEDDVVPDQHAAFGIQRATQKAREPAWRDLGLEGLMVGGPPVERQARGGATRLAGVKGSVLTLR